MLIKVDDIRKIRQVAKNIPDEKIEIYIREAESLDIIPYIGAAFYQKLNNIGDIKLDEVGNYLRDHDDTIISTQNEDDLPINEWKFLNGGYYKTQNGELKHFEGIRIAICYYSYARFVLMHSTQVSPFGVVTKMGDESNASDLKTITAISAEARKIADEYLRQSMEYWNEVRSVTDFKPGTARKRRRFIPIGD